MPSRTKKAAAAVKATPPSITKELVDRSVTGPTSAEAVSAHAMAFKNALIERALGADLSHHMSHAPAAAKPAETSYHRDGVNGKTVLSDDGPLRIEVPRDPDGSFEPLSSASMRGVSPASTTRSSPCTPAAPGMAMREIHGTLAEQNGLEVSPEFISSLTEAVMAEVVAWQGRSLEPMYPFVFFEALRVTIREVPLEALGVATGYQQATVAALPGERHTCTRQAPRPVWADSHLRRCNNLASSSVRSSLG